MDTTAVNRSQDSGRAQKAGLATDWHELLIHININNTAAAAVNIEG